MFCVMVFFVSRIMSNEISKNNNKILKKNISILKYINRRWEKENYKMFTNEFVISKKVGMKMKKVVSSILIFCITIVISVFPVAARVNDVQEKNKLTTGTLEVKATTQSGQWIQATDGRWWYKHTDGTYTKNNWEYINGNWYYFDGNGWMVTGWIKISYAGQYNNKPYWNYFNTNGEFVTDSDTKGCEQGKNTYLDHKCINSSYMKYCISTTAKSETSIITAASYWNNLSNCHASFTKGQGSLNCHVNVTSSTRFDSTTLGITYFFMKEILQNHKIQIGRDVKLI